MPPSRGVGRMGSGRAASSNQRVRGRTRVPCIDDSLREQRLGGRGGVAPACRALMTAIESSG
eukprot:1795806-Prymnesium_polylepis.1